MKNLSVLILLLAMVQPGYAQLKKKKSRSQLPGFISRSFLNFNMGYINTPLSAQQLNKNFHAESIDGTNLGVRLVFLGYRFNQHISAQVSYWKPVSYTQYKNINGDGKTYSAWIHHGTATMRLAIPLNKKISLYGEGGLGIVSRRGFEVNGAVGVSHSTGSSMVMGAGLDFRLGKKWDLTAGTTYSTPVKKIDQPYTIFHSAGIRYHIQPLEDEKADIIAREAKFFPDQMIQFGYSSNRFGYEVNDFFSKGPVPIFWGGRIHISKGAFLRYQKNLFHTKRFFSFDIGASAGWWQGAQQKQNIYSFSFYPLFRFSLLRTGPADFYFNYCVAGPSYITRTMIDGKNSGRNFTFQDFMGVGMFAGKNRHLNAEVLINHYSNGNIFPFNAGLKIPLTFSLGYAF